MSKSLFHYHFDENKYKMPAISSSIYTYRISTMLEQILNHRKRFGASSGQYKNIIIDMPPGDDEYSDLLLYELRKAAKENDNVQLHYYSVTTNDIGHMHLAVQKVRDIMTDNGTYSPLKSINVILNCLLKEDDFPLNTALDPDTIKYITDIQSRLSNKGKLLRNGHIDTYHKFCRSSAVSSFECDTSHTFTEVAVAANQLRKI